MKKKLGIMLSTSVFTFSGFGMELINDKKTVPEIYGITSATISETVMTSIGEVKTSYLINQSAILLNVMHRCHEKAISELSQSLISDLRELLPNVFDHLYEVFSKHEEPVRTMTCNLIAISNGLLYRCLYAVTNENYSESQLLSELEEKSTDGECHFVSEIFREKLKEIFIEKMTISSALNSSV